MTRIRRGIQHLLVVSACVACMPLPRQLFVPEGTGGLVRYTTCSNKGVPDSIEFDIQGMKLDVRVAAITDGRHYLEARFEVPNGKVVQLQGDRVTYLWANRRPGSEGVFEKISLAGGNIFAVEQPALQPYMKPVSEPMVGRRNFWLSTYVTPQPDGDFSVVLPPITVNGVVTALPEVFFRKGPFAVIAPLNC
jgi:hypothetical protein